MRRRFTKPSSTSSPPPGSEHRSLPFPTTASASNPRSSAPPEHDDQPRDPAGEVMAAFADVSRRIEHLARELKCFGFFDDDRDRPRAA